MSNRRDFTKADPKFTGNEGAVVPGGTQAQRATVPAQGTVRYNTDLGLAEFYTATGWAAVAPPPSVSNISGTINEDTDSVITINGSGFDAGAIVSITGAAVGGLERQLVTTFVNSGELTAQTNASTVSYVGAQSFDVKVTNTTGLSTTLTPAGTVDRDPIWSTAGGSRGSFTDNVNLNITHSASDPDGTGITYSIASGSIPAGTTLNTSTGTITGNPTDVSNSTNYTYTLSAASNGQSENRAFSITITPTLDGSTSARAFAELSDLSNAYTTDQTNLWYTYKGGLSAVQMGSNARVDFTDPANPRFETTATNGTSGNVNGISGSCISATGTVGGCSEGTSNAFNWYNALRACMLAGYRLCTRAEIQGEAAQGSGCGHDANAIWTSTPGGAGYYLHIGAIGSYGQVETTSAPGTIPNLSAFTDPQIGFRCCTRNSGPDFWTI